MVNPESQWFGRKSVTPQEKTQMVLGVFDSVASRYDLMNDLMSLGIHRLWKDTLIRKIRPTPHLSYLDVAGGTGDIAFRIAEKAGKDAKITISDINVSMLEVGKARAIDRGYIPTANGGFNWVEANAENLPFEDNSFDVYTISFGLRNVTRIDTALKEACRVLKPGGRFFCMEFSHLDNEVLQKLYDLYSYNIIPKMGRYVTGDEDSYQYLVESIRAFPSQEDLCTRLLDAGFSRSIVEPLTLGVVAIHQAWKY
ncbi:MAG TPA: bifunctional demethylmenaquinone methyltransferase/2-methoxy-6-polyprenyl-1,4-benzoquinol methylase UbiE [Alphaproteobacteria bacterium]|nr:bifunctional demethylmenaquinone methyltransferase/2-methoxy-6-polyprenyl-1,4-benzoquinol methylase UbiE [Alphaproteobacteria bacterium]